MTCQLNDLKAETITYTYDVFGNPVSQESKQFDVPIVLPPPGTFEYRFDASAPADDDFESRLHEMGFEQGDSNLYRFCVAEVETVVGLQYNQARHFDATIGHWRGGDGTTRVAVPCTHGTVSRDRLKKGCDVLSQRGRSWTHLISVLRCLAGTEASRHGHPK